MLPVGPAVRVTIFVGESHRYQGRNAYRAVFDFLFYHQVSGATVTRGIAGFGADHHLHTTDILAASENLPIKIEFIESEARAQQILPRIQEMIGDGVITVQPVSVYFAGRAAATATPAPPAHTRLTGRCKLLRIYVGEHDRWRGRPLHEALVESLRAHDIAGVTVYRGIAGYGPGSRKRAQGAPLMLSVVDTEERLRAYLPLLEGMISSGLVAISDVEVIKYAHTPAEGAS